MGRNQISKVAIVRASTKTGAMVMTEDSREFCTVLETVSATGHVISPFIV